MDEKQLRSLQVGNKVAMVFVIIWMGAILVSVVMAIPAILRGVNSFGFEITPLTRGVEWLHPWGFIAIYALGIGTLIWVGLKDEFRFVCLVANQIAFMLSLAAGLGAITAAYSSLFSIYQRLIN